MARQEFRIKEVTAEQMAELRRIAREEERCDRVEWYVNYDEYPIYRLRGPEPTTEEARYGQPTLYFYDDDAGEWRGVDSLTSFECMDLRRSQEEASGAIAPLTAADWAAAERKAMAELRGMAHEKGANTITYYTTLLHRPIYRLRNNQTPHSGKHGPPLLYWFDWRGAPHELAGNALGAAMVLHHRQNELSHHVDIHQQTVNSQ